MFPATIHQKPNYIRNFYLGNSNITVWLFLAAKQTLIIVLLLS